MPLLVDNSSVDDFSNQRPASASEPKLTAGRTAIIIGQRATCLHVQQQLAMIDHPPIVLGLVLTDLTMSGELTDDVPTLGGIDELEHIIARRRPSMALLSLPSAMSEQIRQIRVRLRRLGVADRFLPTIDDQIAGVGPRSEFTIDPRELLGRPQRAIDSDSIANLIQGRTVLITGAGGSIGSELCRVVASYRPKRLVMVERSENALFEIDRQIARFHPELPRKALLHDIVDPIATLEHFQAIQPEIIFHSAAHKHVPMMEDHPAAAIDNNFYGTKSVADAADRVGADRFVMISTDKAVNPSSIMGATKRLAEMYVQFANRRSSTAFSMVRFGNVLGSAGSVLEVWSRQVREGGPITVTDARMTRYFMTIPEAATLVIQAAALVQPEERGDEVFLLDMGDPVRIVELAARFCRMHGLEPIIDGEPTPARAGSMRIAITGARPGEKLFEELSRDVEALRPTRHPDIHIWSLPEPTEADIHRVLRQLDPRARGKDPIEIATRIRGLVPEMVQPVAA